MHYCNTCNKYHDLTRMTLTKGVVSKLCKDCKNAGKKRRNLEKKQGKFLDKNSLEYRSSKFLEKALAAHQGIYRYDRVNFIDSNSKVEIFCTKHEGYFWQSPTSHTSGNGCFDCGILETASKRKYTKEEYIKLATSVWGDAYDYSEIDYADCFTEIKIRCPVHGLVGVVPTQHLSGRGCKECAKNGYNIAKPGHLYILANGDMTKVGITNTTPEARCKVLSRKHENQFEVIHSAYWEDGNIANDIETLLLRNLKVEYNNPDDRFHGWTETFLNVDRNKLINQLKELSHDSN